MDNSFLKVDDVETRENGAKSTFWIRIDKLK